MTSKDQEALYTMNESEVLDAVEGWIRNNAKGLGLPNAVHFDLKIDSEKRRFYVEVTEKIVPPGN